MMNEVSLWWVIFIVVCAAALYGLRFFKTSKESKDQGFTDQITEGNGVYVGFVDKARPDMYVRPRMRGGFWGDKYTPIWLRKKRKEEEKDSEEETEEELKEEG